MVLSLVNVLLVPPRLWVHPLLRVPSVLTRVLVPVGRLRVAPEPQVDVTFVRVGGSVNRGWVIRVVGVDPVCFIGRPWESRTSTGYDGGHHSSSVECNFGETSR